VASDGAETREVSGIESESESTVMKGQTSRPRLPAALRSLGRREERREGGGKGGIVGRNLAEKYVERNRIERSARARAEDDDDDDDLIGFPNTYKISNVKQRHPARNRLCVSLDRLAPDGAWSRVATAARSPNERSLKVAGALPIIKEIGSKLPSPLQTSPR